MYAILDLFASLAAGFLGGVFLFDALGAVFVEFDVLVADFVLSELGFATSAGAVQTIC